MMIQSAVLMSMPESRFIWARTVEEARIITCEHPVSVLLLDVELPDGNGIDFLEEAALIQPEARAIIMTGNPLPAYKQRADSFGNVRFFEKPVPPDQLLRALRELLAPSTRASDENFQGTIKNLTPIDVIQLKCMANATTIMHFKSDTGDGRIYFESGRIVHAETTNRVGEKALAEIVGFKGGKVVEERSQPVKPTLHADWQSLLMNAAHAQDERAAGSGLGY
jgi:DNA-binding response OmpR family regulator